MARERVQIPRCHFCSCDKWKGELGSARVLGGKFRPVNTLLQEIEDRLGKSKEDSRILEVEILIDVGITQDGPTPH